MLLYEKFHVRRYNCLTVNRKTRWCFPPPFEFEVLKGKEIEKPPQRLKTPLRGIFASLYLPNFKTKTNAPGRKNTCWFWARGSDWVFG